MKFLNIRSFCCWTFIFLWFVWVGVSLVTSAAAQDKPKDSKEKSTAEPKETTQEEKPRGKSALSVQVRLINLEITVSDKKGNLITGLKSDNFTVYEDNVRQEITNFAPVEAPITVVLVIDYSRIAYRLGWNFFGNEIWDAMYEFTRTLRKGDWAAVVAYDMRPEILTDFTQDQRKVHDALRRINTPAFSESNLADAVSFVLERVEEIEGKPAVILLSTGLDTFSKVTYDFALKKTQNTNAVIYSVGIGQSNRMRQEPYMRGETSIEFSQADNRLRSLSEYSGGAAFFPRFTSEFRNIFADISARLRHMYSLGYVSSNTKKDGKFRKIRVEVNANVAGHGKSEKLKVAHRKGYIAPKE
ncbi:MAG: VWA domain-containing protein [Acidobacteria bacterium]|nr:VWA domain-containing protein [Acidobacteriota bacterium]MBI3657475.1 VWA domain-containing protein [Acidobacteriota bacterium]